MMTSRVLSISVCLLAAATASAQERLSLADATARALEKNHTIKIGREAIVAAESRMTSARGEYDPLLRFNVDYDHHKDPITTLFSGAPAGQVAPTQNDFSTSASLSQLFKSGATATISTSAAREGTNSGFSLFQPAYITSLGVDLRQPLLRNRAIDPARASLRVTALDRDRSSAALARQVLETVSEVERAYWQLVDAQRDLEIRRVNVTLAERQRRDTEIRIEARTVAPADLAQPTAELEKRRGDVFAAQEAVARADRALKELMLDDPSDPMWAVEFAPTDRPADTSAPVDVAGALSDAEKNRPEIAELAARISQNEIDVTLARDNVKPRLDLVAGYTMRGLAGDQNSATFPFGDVPLVPPSSLIGGLGNSLANLGTQKFPDATVGISFEMPLGRKGARGQLGAAEATRRQSTTTLAQTKQQIAVEVRNAATALETAAGRIQAARAGLVAAQTQLRAEQDRFAVGATTNFFVLTRQNDLAQAKLTEMHAQTDYQKALIELARAKGTLLRDRGIHVE